MDLLKRCLFQLVPVEGSCHVQMSGGEPTLVPDLIETAAQTLKKERPHASMGIQTNATLLDRSLVRMFAKYNIQVGVSLDGPVEVQERLRGHAVKTLKGLKLMESENVPFRVTTVVSNGSVATLDKLVLMLGGFKNGRGIGLDLLIDKGNAPTNNTVSRATLSQTAEGISRMMVALKMVNGNRRLKLALREEDAVKRALQGKTSARFCHAGSGESVVVCPDGSLYPCSQTAGDSRFFMGTLSKPEMARAGFLSEFALSSDDCESCGLFNRCPGDCHSRQYYNDPEARRLICTVYQTIMNGRTVK